MAHIEGGHSSSEGCQWWLDFSFAALKASPVRLFGLSKSCDVLFVSVECYLNNSSFIPVKTLFQHVLEIQAGSHGLTLTKS